MLVIALSLRVCVPFTKNPPKGKHWRLLPTVMKRKQVSARSQNYMVLHQTPKIDFEP